jgi:hypothetical protein
MPESDATEKEAPKRSTRSRSTATNASASAPAPKSAASDAPPAPPPAPSAQATSQLSGAVSEAMTAVRERLHAGEQFVLAGAALVVAVYVVFQLLISTVGLGDTAVWVALVTLAAIWVQRWGHHDFGTVYRVLVSALGMSLAVFAVLNFLAFVRRGGGGDGLALLGIIIFWAAGLIAGYGGFRAWRSDRA